MRRSGAPASLSVTNQATIPTIRTNQRTVMFLFLRLKTMASSKQSMRRPSAKPADMRREYRVCQFQSLISLSSLLWCDEIGQTFFLAFPMPPHRIHMPSLVFRLFEKDGICIVWEGVVRQTYRAMSEATPSPHVLSAFTSF